MNLRMITKSNFFKIIKYGFSSGSSLIIDLSFFAIFNYFFNNVFFATILARIISSLYNYFVNSRFVFKSYSRSSIIKYYVLVIIQMFASAIFVSILCNFIKNINQTFIKLFVDIIIFIVNYFVQKEVVFK